MIVGIRDIKHVDALGVRQVSHVRGEVWRRDLVGLLDRDRGARHCRVVQDGVASLPVDQLEVVCPGIRHLAEAPLQEIDPVIIRNDDLIAIDQRVTTGGEESFSVWRGFGGDSGRHCRAVVQHHPAIDMKAGILVAKLDHVAVSIGRLEGDEINGLTVFCRGDEARSRPLAHTALSLDEHVFQETQGRRVSLKIHATVERW